jgi:hypothetical protein
MKKTPHKTNLNLNKSVPYKGTGFPNFLSACKSCNRVLSPFSKEDTLFCPDGIYHASCFTAPTIRGCRICEQIITPYTKVPTVKSHGFNICSHVIGRTKGETDRKPVSDNKESRDYHGNPIRKHPRRHRG